MTSGSPLDGLEPIRRWAVNWLAGSDVAAAEQCIAEDYVLQIGAFTLSPRSAYVDGTVTQLARYPGLGVTVHDVITDGRRTVVRLSEHGASTRHDGAIAGWRVVALLEHDAGGIRRGWAEEDYWARRRQLADGRPDPVDRPALAPWTTTPLEPDLGAAEAVTRWIEAGAPALRGVVRDDEDLVAAYDMPLTTERGSIDVMVVSGRRVGFHAVLEALTADRTTVRLPSAGLIEVSEDGTITGHLVTDRLGLPRSAQAR